MSGLRRTAVIGIISGGALVAFSTVGVQARQQKASATPAMTPQQALFFESKVRPVLVNNCFSCHGNGKHTADISLDSMADLLKGNGHGPSLVPGDPDKSTLIHVLSYTGKVKMPPAGKLRVEEIAALTAWVKMGAPWPAARGNTAEGEAPKSGGKPEKIVSTAEKQAWPFKAFQKPVPPRVKDTLWAKTPIDRFILAKLEAKSLKPAAPANRRDLVRRAYFDLIGLPPTPQEVEAFVNDKSPNAFTKVVDRLLADPHYGERWGRHWLDVVRYADSNGLDENIAFANAFRYRDYVIDAFNKDKPYDQFTREQLAGDLMPASNDEERNEHLVATGFLSLGPKVLAEPDKPKMVMDIVDEQIEVTSKTFLGLTVACARCHDHKFDPIPTKDYYALAGIFKSTRTMESLNTVARCYERPLITASAKMQIETQKQKVKEFEENLKRETNKANQDLVEDERANLAKYLLAGWELSQQPGTDSLASLPAHPSDTRLFVPAVKFNRSNAHIDNDVYGKGIGIIHTVAVPTFAEWDVTVPKTGLYQVEMRYASNESRPIRLMLNGQSIKENTAAQVTGSFNPDGQRWEVQGVFTFAAGKNTVRIERNGDIPHINTLLIVPVDQNGKGKRVRPAEQIASESKLNPALVRLWASRLRVAQNDPIMGAFLRYALIPEDRFTQQAPTVSAQLASTGTLPAVVTAFDKFTGTGLEQVAAIYQELFKRSLDAKNNELGALRTKLTEAHGLLAVPDKPETYYAMASAKTITDLTKNLQTVKASMSEVPMAMAVEEGKIENCRVHLRGNTQTLGDEVPRHFLAIVADGDKAVIDSKSSGRLELAQWLTRPDHPLTGRVEMNRVWQEHFGAGLTRTPENFGLLGERPSHPELLDWLAATFVEKGWSIKQMHRQIMLTNTYQMSTTQDAKAALTDPDNRLLSHATRRRLEVEPFRDALLAVSGKLDLSFGGSLLSTPNNGYVTNDQSGNGANYNAPRRSIYLPIIRNALFDMFQAFDMSDPSIVSARRSTTTVSPQALYMMNSPFVMEQSRAFDALLQKADKTDAARINDAYLRAYGRSVAPTEIARATAFLARYQTALARSIPDPVKRQQVAWDSLCQVILASNEFIYIN